jgi:hypothetical protein
VEYNIPQATLIVKHIKSKNFGITIINSHIFV